MRRLTTSRALTLAAAALLAGPAPAQTAATPAVVTAADALVRCKPSDDPKLYATNLLKRGDRVWVVEPRTDGWVGIMPPEGSFSWIKASWVKRVVPDQRNYVVVAPDKVKVPVLVGSGLKKDGRPTVEGTHLVQGHIARAIGPPQTDTEGEWLPIQAPPGEVRYVRAEALSTTGTAPVVAAKPPDPEPRGGAPALPPVRADAADFSKPHGALPNASGNRRADAAPLADAQTLWQRAYEAERAGRYNDAIDIYVQLARDPKVLPDAASWAGRRANYLRDNYARPPVPSVPAQPVSRATQSSFQPGAPQLGAPQGVAPETSRVAHGGGPANGAVQGSSGPGWLKPSGRTDLGVTLYRLDDDFGRPKMYAAAAGPGVNLERYLNRKVQLTGTLIYHGELKANYIHATRADPAD